MVPDEDAFVGSVEYLASAQVKTTVRNIRAFEDGNKVFLQTVYNFAGTGEQLAFDIFRFNEDGLIAEHWDNLAAVATPNPSGHTQIDGLMEIKDIDNQRRQVNISMVIHISSTIQVLQTAFPGLVLHWKFLGNWEFR